MRYRQCDKTYFFHLTIAAMIFAGCAGQIQKPLRVCPGKETVPDALSTLRLHFQNAVPLKANGQCLLEYLAEGKASEGKLSSANLAEPSSWNLYAG